MPAAPAGRVDLSWLGGFRGQEADLVTAAGIPLRRLVLRSLRSTELSGHLLLDPIRLAVSVPQALALLLRHRPAAIFTTGGFVAVPALLAAALLRIPVVLWEGNVIPGRSVRVTAPLATILAVSHAETRRVLGAHCYVTGTPIRDVQLDRPSARRHFGLEPDARVLLIFGGSQAAQRLNGAVKSALARLVDRVEIIHVTGQEGYAAALADRDGLPPSARGRYRPYPFLREEMGAALAAASLVVGRAGSSTIAEVTALGLPMVVVPYPHAAGHQRANARMLAETGAAVVVEDDAFDDAAILAAAAILDDPARCSAMAAAAQALGRPGAAEAVARLVRSVATRRPRPATETIDRLSRGLAA